MQLEKIENMLQELKEFYVKIYNQDLGSLQNLRKVRTQHHLTLTISI